MRKAILIVGIVSLVLLMVACKQPAREYDIVGPQAPAEDDVPVRDYQPSVTPPPVEDEVPELTEAEETFNKLAENVELI